MVEAPTALTSHDLFLHVRVIVGVVLGLTVGKLLAGASTYIEHPLKQKVSIVHLLWVLWALISVMGSWWWEFRLANVPTWTFGSYCFIFVYTSCYYLIASVLFPAEMREYAGYADYFMSRRRWIFGIIALTYLLDIGDTWLKGFDYMRGFGLAYEVRVATALIGCGLGAAISNRHFQAVLAVAAIIYQLVWLIVFFERLV